MESIKPLLLDFLQAGDDFKRILVVESLAYLPGLRERFPAAEIHAAAADEEMAEREEYRQLSVVWHFLEYREEPLPFPKEFFDVIFSDLTLEHVANPQDIAAGFSMFLKQTGCWFTSFRNIRCWKILKQLMDGHYSGLVSRFYARPDFEKLLYASFYKEVRMLPVRKEAPQELLKRLLACGFENLQGDLETEFWLVRAARSMPELSLLKSMYTFEERKALSRILHRIEYDIETKKSVRAFWELYERTGMFEDYAAEFVHEAVMHREHFYENLLRWSAEKADAAMRMKVLEYGPAGIAKAGDS